MEEPLRLAELHQFRLNGKNLVLDVETARVFGVDDLAYDILLVADGAEPSSIRSRLATRYSPEDVDAVFEELSETRLLVQQPPAPPTFSIQGVSDRPVVSMDLILSQDCNMRCRYCFADTGAFHGIRTLMTKEVADAAIDFLVRRSQGEKKLHIGFFGGEPLLNLPILRYVVERGEGKAREALKDMSFAMSTNGTLLTEDLISYFHSKKISVQMSIDGDEETQNRNRPYIGNGPTYDDVVHNAQNLFRITGKPITARVTVTSWNTTHVSANVEHLLSLGFHTVHLETASGAKGKVFIKSRKHLEDLKEQFSIVADRFLRKIESREFYGVDNIIKVLRACNINDRKIHPCGAGRGYLCVGENGDLFPCHRFVGNSRYVMGNVLTDAYDPTWERTITRDIASINRPSCRSCWARYFCAGDCIAIAEEYFSDITIPDGLRCELQKHIIELGLMIYAHLKKEDKGEIEKLYRLPTKTDVRREHESSDQRGAKAGMTASDSVGT